jgi:amidophosphoribosyltransferase
MCGIIGISKHRDAAELAYTGLFSLQHRGQESCGIVTSHRGELKGLVGMGLLGEVFGEERLKQLPGTASIGHVRYSTTGSSRLENAQPFVFNHFRGMMAIAHNGNLTNAAELRAKLERDGAIFQSGSDSEVLVHLVARSKGRVENAIVEALKTVEGAYSLLFLTPERLVAARDPRGFRPLVLGRLGRSYVVASETCALNMLGAKLVREIEPGEVLVIEGERLSSSKPFPPAPAARCVFEHVYFARPDSAVFGRSVHGARREMGRQLAREMRGVPADMVVPVPDSGIQAALGFSEESGIPFEMGFIRNHYVGRTFIQPSQAMRERGVEMKLHPVREVLQGRKIVLIDDSIVRGTTCRKIVRMLRRAKVKEVRLAISSPPIVSPCYYGIDTPEASQLIAAKQSIEATRKYLGVDGLHYLSLDGMLKSAGGAGGPGGFCTACFTKKYPTDIRGASISSCPAPSAVKSS